MSVASREALLVPFQTAVEEHDCPYAERIIKLSRLQNIGGTAFGLSSLLEEMTELHADSACPPTHIDQSPTKEWSDWVRGTKS